MRRASRLFLRRGPCAHAYLRTPRKTMEARRSDLVGSDLPVPLPTWRRRRGGFRSQHARHCPTSLLRPILRRPELPSVRHAPVWGNWVAVGGTKPRTLRRRGDLPRATPHQRRAHGFATDTHPKSSNNASGTPPGPPPWTSTATSCPPSTTARPPNSKPSTPPPATPPTRCAAQTAPAGDGQPWADHPSRSAPTKTG